ncbi:MAG: hypothetical protein HUU57_17065 [Bdellovibrio sp.]|nr:hypothetical protein [Bdellovibrio sp.]
MENSCCACFGKKANLECGICKGSVCKKCAQFLEEDAFSFMTTRPHELRFSVYCPQCYDATVGPALLEYKETMQRAQEILIFNKDQGKETRLLSRKEPPVQVLECDDREETLLRLAFVAAQGNFNGLIDVDLVSKKVRQGTYQTQKWSGTAVPTFIDPKRLNK